MLIFFVDSPWLTNILILLVPLPTLNEFMPPWNIIPLEDSADITVLSVILVSPADPNLIAVVLIGFPQLGFPWESVLQNLLASLTLGAVTIPAVFNAFTGIEVIALYHVDISLLVLY